MDSGDSLEHQSQEGGDSDGSNNNVEDFNDVTQMIYGTSPWCPPAGSGNAGPNLDSAKISSPQSAFSHEQHQSNPVPLGS